VESLVATAFMMGLLGGVHCVAMCGGIVGAVSLRGSAAGTALQLSYNAGRVVSYSVAGALAGALGSIGLIASGLLPAQMILFIIANTVVVLLGLHIAGWGRLVLRLEAMGASAWRIIQPLGIRFLPADTPAKAIKLGLVWGWIPCGLVYSALALGLVSGGPMHGAGIMLAFGLGTLPNLLAAGLIAQRIRPVLRLPWVRSLAGGIMIVLGAIGLARIPGLPEAIRSGILCLA
jgi:sulfite exporter TauE/SafE